VNKVGFSDAHSWKYVVSNAGQLTVADKEGS